ncbi:MAG: DUF3276 family protein [Paludibacter sp.]|nr:DUF3276 family protein [Paludibacter sp.]
METKELFTEKLIKGHRTYFFDIKQTESKSLYITITESKKIADGYEHHKVMVFEENIEDFTNVFRNCLLKYKQLKNEPSIIKTNRPIAEIQKKYPNAYMPWTPEDDEKLESLYIDGKEIKELELVFYRKRGAIVSRLKHKGLLK